MYLLYDELQLLVLSFPELVVLYGVENLASLTELELLSNTATWKRLVYFIEQAALQTIFGSSIFTLPLAAFQFGLCCITIEVTGKEV